jgi:3-oxoacyl-[acyl-carrier-protein] synthase-3
LKKVCIQGTGSFIPERVVPNAYFEGLVNTSNEWIVSRTGIEERRMVLPGQALSDLVVPAAEKALEMADLSPAELDLIIIGTSTADMPSPSAGCIVQHRIGAHKAVAFDVNAACPGFLYGLAVAQKFMQDGSHQHTLVVGGEIVSHRTDFQDRNTCVLFGDGAGAVVLGQHTQKGDGELLSTRIYSDGDLWGLLNVPGGGSLNPPTHEMIDQRLHYVKMKGNEVFKHAVRSMVEASKAALEESGISGRQIDWFIPHQANIRIIEAVAKLMEVPMEKVILTVHKYGNTSAATIPTALDEAVRSDRIKRGHLVLTASFGAGFTWGASLFRF